MDAEEQQVMLEFMNIVGKTAHQARQFLEATSWELNKVVQLYFAHNNKVGPGSTSASDRMVEDENYVRPPLPVTREALYEDGGHHIRYPGYSFVDPSRNFEDEANEQSSWALGEGTAHNTLVDGSSRNSLAALYRPPLDFAFQGTFEQAKIEAARHGKWLLVNLQSKIEFASYTLNRDTWGHEAMKAVVSTSFVLWQINNDTKEGIKVCNYYKVTMIPSILVIDSTTGQKMRSWNGMIDVERLLEDLERYIDHGPLENHPIRLPIPCQSTEDPMVVEVADEELAAALDLSLAVEPSESDADEEDIIPIVYPTLPKEPEIKASGACRVGIRYPNGSKSERRFLMSDSVKLVWSFCNTQVKEAEERSQFHFI